ncbi:MarR family winged helix-turn-helix transcriptional regulator [Streptomyces sp. NPDC002896]|uniref:MarR family winged helix-turn-helix transcriptional regulator n=1 Tax=Streptomyces sp. NPDC002896 TaxID=3154438 RepID=UPI00332F4522
MSGRHTSLREFTPALRDTARILLRAAEQRAGVHPLPPSEADMMRLIVRDPGVSPGRLATELLMKPSNVSAALRHLTEHGLVSRETDPADRRATRVLPTPQAVTNARRIEDTWAHLIDEVLDDLDPGDAQTLLHALPALRALEAALRARHSAPQTASS